MKHEQIKSLKPGALLRAKDTVGSGWIVESNVFARKVEVISTGDVIMFIEWPPESAPLFKKYEGAYFLVRDKIVWLHFTQLYSLDEVKTKKNDE